MAIKRKKIGNTTITINTRTGRQTTSRRVGNITYSQSNQGHNRSTQTTNYNWNKKSRRSKSKPIDWSWLFGSKKKTCQEKNARAASMPDSNVARGSLPEDKANDKAYSWPFWVFWFTVAIIYETYKRGYWG
jgi:hypothetical protein